MYRINYNGTEVYKSTHRELTKDFYECKNCMMTTGQYEHSLHLEIGETMTIKGKDKVPYIITKVQ